MALWDRLIGSTLPGRERHHGVGVSSPVVATGLRHFAKRSAMLIKTSRLVPFTMHNYCCRDELGRESLAVMRSLNYTTGPTPAIRSSWTARKGSSTTSATDPSYCGRSRPTPTGTGHWSSRAVRCGCCPDRRSASAGSWCSTPTRSVSIASRSRSNPPTVWPPRPERLSPAH